MPEKNQSRGTMYPTPSTILPTAFPILRENDRVLWLLSAILGSLLLTLSAKIQIPFWPVPMTMQTYMVLVLAGLGGWRFGGGAVLLYLMQGLMGFPVFAGTPHLGIGLPYMLGPTGGFLLGFLAAALCVGWLSEKGWSRTLTQSLALMLLGHAIIFAMGLAWLMLPMGAGMGLEQAFLNGLHPFWLATALKTLLAAFTLPALWRLMGRHWG